MAGPADIAGSATTNAPATISATTPNISPFRAHILRKLRELRRTYSWQCLAFPGA